MHSEDMARSKNKEVHKNSRCQTIQMLYLIHPLPPKLPGS
jgi:hypothetical protein